MILKPGMEIYYWGSIYRITNNRLYTNDKGEPLNGIFCIVEHIETIGPSGNTLVATKINYPHTPTEEFYIHSDPTGPIIPSNYIEKFSFVS